MIYIIEHNNASHIAMRGIILFTFLEAPAHSDCSADTIFLALEEVSALTFKGKEECIIKLPLDAKYASCNDCTIETEHLGTCVGSNTRDITCK